MKNLVLIIGLSACTWTAGAQSKTTTALAEKFDPSISAFFYKNTLRMLNQNDIKEFDELIRNVEKLKFLMFDKATKNFDKAAYAKLTGEYRKESFEPIVTSRLDGRNFDIFLRDKGNSKPGTVILVNDSASLFVLDIVGTIDVSKAGSLFSVIDGSPDMGKMLRYFNDDKNDSTRRHKAKRGVRVD
jgi:hypothetical protein